jgi:glycerol-3-phosphate acyltransferase PlsY
MVISKQREIIRKTIHLSTASIILFDMISHTAAILVTTFMILFYTLSEIARLRRIRIFYIHELVEICARPNESKGFITAPIFLAIPILLVLIFFKQSISYPSILAVTISDSFATLVGINFGKTKIFNKTFEGSLTFFVLTFLIFGFFYDLTFSIFAAFLITLTELLSKKLDNLTIPLFSAFILSLT